MILCDVNILVYAHRKDTPDHRSILEWFETVINSDQAYGMSEFVLSEFMRIVTHPRIFSPPSKIEQALAFANQLREQPNCVLLTP